MSKVLLVEQIKSTSKLNPKQAATLKSLGLRGRGSKVVRQDLRAIRGMLNHIQHVVRAERLDQKDAEARTARNKNASKGYEILK